MTSDNCLCRDKPASPGGSQKAEEGFTLLELISVVAIIAVLAAISIPSYGAYITKARIGRTIVELHMLEREIYIYRSHERHLPDTLGDIGHGDLNDPWGNPYQYLKIEDSGIKGNGMLRRDRAINPLNTDYDLYSMGSDGESKTNLNARESLDDIVRARDGAFIDLAEKF